MGLINRNQQKDILDNIKPLIHKVTEERVTDIMKNIQKQQIESYEQFFDKQEQRFEENLNRALDKKIDMIADKVMQRLQERGLSKG